MLIDTIRRMFYKIFPKVIRTEVIVISHRSKEGKIRTLEIAIDGSDVHIHQIMDMTENQEQWDNLLEHSPYQQDKIVNWLFKSPGRGK